MRVALVALLWLLALTARSQVSDIKRNETVLLFPSLAAMGADGKSWEVEVRGCVFELKRRRLTLLALREALGLKGVKMSPAEQALFNERARLFLVDHERRKHVVVRCGDKTAALEASAPDGRFAGTLHLSAGEVERLRKGPTVLKAVLPAADPRRFTGEILFVEPVGTTIISDIDDTIKVTGVGERKAMLRNTFLQPFEPVRGMAEVYGAWARQPGVLFCYVSASPWQLYEPLSAFVHSNGFPAGVFFLKKFRWKDESFFALFQNPERYKPAVLGPLFERFPRRRFVLVGDSGERDPEIYGALARQYPQQVSRILIRNVTGEPADAVRYQKAFADLRPGLGQVFNRPEEIEQSISR